MKNKKTTLIPLLRFKEFTEPWCLEKAGNLFNSRREKGREGIPIYSVSLKKGMVPRSSIEKQMKGDAKAELNFVVYPGDIAYNTMRMWQGAMGFSDEQCMVSPAYIVLQPRSHVATRFYIYLLGSHKYLYALKSFSYGLTNDRLRLYYKDFSLIPLPLTTKKEQQKIANFLTLFDKRINQLTEKQSLLQQYKKGVMQKLFSQEIRFKDDQGNDFSSWEQKKLGELFLHRSERKLDKAELLSVTISDGVKKRSAIDGQDNSSDDKSNYKKVVVGDMVYNSMRMWQGASGVSLYDGIVSPAYTVLKPNNICINYFGYFFKTIEMLHVFQRNSQGMTSDTWNLKYPQLSSIKIMCPELDEQKKIAAFLGELDKKIHFTNQQIEQTQIFKKGLLQQMFV